VTAAKQRCRPRTLGGPPPEGREPHSAALDLIRADTKASIRGKASVDPKALVKCFDKIWAIARKQVPAWGVARKRDLWGQDLPCQFFIACHLHFVLP
jgi:hypothetical protein